MGWGRGLLLLALACGGSSGTRDAEVDATHDAAERAPVSARLDVSAGFWDAPFPIAHRVRDDGTLVVADFPNARRAPLVDQMLAMLEEAPEGFAADGAIFLPFDGALDATTLPATPAASVADESAVFLIDVDPSSPTRGRRYPVEVVFRAEAQSYAPENVLSVWPFPGVVLPPRTLHAVVVTSRARDVDGRALRRPEALDTLDDAAWRALFEVVPREQVVAATVFPTGDPFTRLRAWRDAIDALPTPTPTDLVRTDDYETYCVLEGRLSVPIFQAGPKPYEDVPDGAIALDATGAPIVQGHDDAVFTVAIPKSPMPEGGYPLVLYAAGAGGTSRQVVDRTRVAEDPDLGLGPAGRGPALFYADVGLAAAAIAAPLTAERNPSGREGTFDFWNVANLRAFRGNLQQATLDFTTLTAAVAAMRVDPALCPGASTDEAAFRFDAERVYLQGHSTGGTVGSVALPLEPRIRAAVLSGTGGSWIYNVADADSPFVLRDVAKVFLRLREGDVVEHHDVELTLFQTVLASVEVMSWGRVTALAPEGDAKDVLLVAGIVDTYHFPRMIHSQGMSLGADLALPSVEPTWEDEYTLVGLRGLGTPVRGNVRGEVTSVMLQRAQREGVDGHYVPFEHDDLKRRYACFLASHARDGRATLYADGVDARCE
ncbi:MAG: hypothetical protein KC586_28165 [Myxococcales bacterium]|nr:hypothetical protein [Myxococcales bacterium]